MSFIVKETIRPSSEKLSTRLNLQSAKNPMLWFESQPSRSHVADYDVDAQSCMQMSRRRSTMRSTSPRDYERSTHYTYVTFCNNFISQITNQILCSLLILSVKKITLMYHLTLFSLHSFGEESKYLLREIQSKNYFTYHV